jgi:hypothetical protein
MERGPNGYQVWTKTDLADLALDYVALTGPCAARCRRLAQSKKWSKRGNAESLRFIVRKHGIAHKEVIAPEPEPKVAADRNAARRIAGLEAALAKTSKKLIESRDQTSAIVNQIMHALDVAPDVAFHGPPLKGKKHKVALKLILSDIHSGLVQTLRETAGTGCYNWQIMHQEAQTLAEKVILWRDLLRPRHDIDGLYIAMPGDIVEGEGMRPNQGQFLDKIVVDQTFGVVEMLTKLILFFLGEFRFVRIYATWGNHGRVGHRNDTAQRTNWDYVVERMIAQRLSGQKRAWVGVSDSYAMIYELPHAPGPWLLWHGDNVRSYLNFPYYGLDRALGRYSQVAGRMLRYGVCGHFHKSALLPAAGISHIICNGAWPGPTDFGLVHVQDAQDPCQTLLILHPEMGIVDQFQLLLKGAPRKPMAADSEGVYTPYASE